MKCLYYSTEYRNPAQKPAHLKVLIDENSKLCDWPLLDDFELQRFGREINGRMYVKNVINEEQLSKAGLKLVDIETFSQTANLYELSVVVTIIFVLARQLQPPTKTELAGLLLSSAKLQEMLVDRMSKMEIHGQYSHNIVVQELEELKDRLTMLEKRFIITKCKRKIQRPSWQRRTLGR